MAISDQIVNVESGGDPTATNPNSSAMGLAPNMCEKFRADALIGKLLFGSCPPAIFGRIVAIAIDPIKRVFISWPRSHVGEEILERLPPVAYFDAARSIPLVGNVLWQIASAVHSIPNLILSRGFTAALHRLRFAMNIGRGVFSCSSVATSACLGIAGSKIGNGHGNLGAAVAFAKISPDLCRAIFSDFRCCFGEGGKISKPHSDAIYGGGH